jgi:tetratricopeptide (TPR) repeat protein
VPAAELGSPVSGESIAAVDRVTTDSGIPDGSVPDPVDEVDPRELAADVRAELRSLSRPLAERVARHLVLVGQMIDDDPEGALRHAQQARVLAPRIAAVREALGLAQYQVGAWQAAIAELRTYHRLSGRQTHLAVLADCERALGRPERAVDLYRTSKGASVDSAEAVELLIVAAGARADMGQHDAAVAMLQVRELGAAADEPWTARLRYAYADALLAAGRAQDARDWFARAADADDDLTTDAAERLLELDGVVLDGEMDARTGLDGDGPDIAADADDADDVKVEADDADDVKAEQVWIDDELEADGDSDGAADHDDEDEGDDEDGEEDGGAGDLGAGGTETGR